MCVMTGDLEHMSTRDECWESESSSAMIVICECSWDVEFTGDPGVDVTHNKTLEF